MIGESNQPEEASSLCLAFLGDAVFELFVRELVTAQGGGHVNRLSERARKYVNAAAQARMYFRIWPILSEEERAVMKRGRNAKSAAKAKHATVADYRHATGLEALFGFLHIRGRDERLRQIFKVCAEEVEA